MESKDKIRKVASLLSGAKTSKLMAIGIFPGSSVEVLRRAPFGKVYYVKVDRQVFALREDELALIQFEQ